jgi:hypothetical protein
VPGPLKRAASFTPQRRARIAGRQILNRLVADEEFRKRIGVRANARQSGIAERLALARCAWIPLRSATWPAKD